MNTSQDKLDLQNKTCLVVDHGLFVETAVRLKRDFGRVLYWSTSREAFPTSAEKLIGHNLDGVERVGLVEKDKELFDYIDSSDLIVFPDVYEGDFQTFLRSHGYRVWGSGKADKLETDRWYAKKLISRLGLSVNETDRIVGMDRLRKELQGTKNRWLKISWYRGDMETMKYVDEALSGRILDDLAASLGPKKDTMEFLVEEPIDAVVEIGYDGYCIDDQFPSVAAYGYEKKDRGYYGIVKPYKEFPAFMRKINSALAPTMKQLGLRGNYSNEIRVAKDGAAFLTDPTIRTPSPPGGALLEAFTNLSEFMYRGAGGELVELEPVGRYLAIAEVHCKYAANKFMPIRIPKEHRQWVKLKNLTWNDKDKIYELVPNFGDLIEVGEVVGIGKTKEEAKKKVIEHAEGLDGHDIEIHIEALDQLEETIENGKKNGIPF